MSENLILFRRRVGEILANACFFAFTGSALAAGQLAQLIADLVRERG